MLLHILAALVAQGVELCINLPLNLRGRWAVSLHTLSWLFSFFDILSCSKVFLLHTHGKTTFIELSESMATYSKHRYTYLSNAYLDGNSEVDFGAHMFVLRSLFFPTIFN